VKQKAFLSIKKEKEKRHGGTKHGGACGGKGLLKCKDDPKKRKFGKKAPNWGTASPKEH